MKNTPMNTPTTAPKERSTYVHRRIDMEKACIVPLEVSLRNTEGLSPELVEGCRQYHSFLNQFLSCLYDDPLRFGLPAGAYEAYLDGMKPHAKKRKEPARYDKFRSSAYGAGNTYQRFLYEFCRAARLDGEKLCLEGDAFHKVLHMFRGDKKQRPDDFLTGVPYPLRLQRLREAGLEIDSGEASAEMRCPGQPLMLKAMKALADAGQKVKTFDWYGVQYCEFRQLLSPYRPDFEDVIRFLDEEAQQPLREIHRYLVEHKARPSCDTYHKVDYKYHGVQAVQIGLDEFNVLPRIYVRINGAYWWWPDGETLVNEQLLRRDAKLQDYAQRHVNYCTGCSSSHPHGGYVRILGRQKCLCGGIDFKVFQPGKSEVSEICQLIDIRMDLTDLIKARGKAAKAKSA